MFCLSVVEHLRLNFRLVVQNQTAHAQAAERLASLALKAKIGVLALLCAATAVMIASLFRPGREYQIAAALMGGAAVAAHVISIAIGFETRVHAHRSLAHRLWLVCERYRGLLSEVQDGLLDNATILHRRDLLSEEVHAIYEQGFPIDQPAYEHIRQQPLAAEAPPIVSEGAEQLVPATRS